MIYEVKGLGKNNIYWIIGWRFATFFSYCESLQEFPNFSSNRVTLTVLQRPVRDVACVVSVQGIRLFRVITSRKRCDIFGNPRI